MNLTDIARLLDRCDVDHADPKGEMLPALVVDAAGEMLAVAVIYEEKIQTLQFRVPLFKKPGGAHRDLLVTAMMEINNQYKLVRVGLDPADGEVVVYMDFCLHDATFEESQMQRCLRGLKTIVPKVRNRLKKIADTGEDPGPDSEADSAQQLLELLKQAKAAAETKKGSGRDSHSPARSKPASSSSNHRGGQKDILDDIMRELEDK